MKALTAVLPDLRQLIPHGHGWFTLWIVSVLVGLELFGRTGATADYFDVLAVLILFSVVSFAVFRHRKDPHPWFLWLERFTDRTFRRLVRMRHDLGVDFRGDPPLPRRLPRLIPALFLGVTLVGSIFAAGWAVRPDGWRAVVSVLPYVLYLVVVAGIWMGLIGIMMAGIALPIRVMEGVIEGLAQGSKPAVCAVYFITVLFLSFSFPPAIPLAFAGLILSVCLMVYCRTGAPVPGVVWKGTESKVTSVIPAHRVFAIVVGLATLLAVVLITAACGGTLLERPEWEGTMPLTVMAGAIAAWFIPGIAAVLAAMAWNLYQGDPARRTPATLHISKAIPTEELTRIRNIVSAWGWRLTTAPQKSNSEAVSIQIVPAELSEAREFDPGWPLKVCLEDLTEEVVKDRLIRRDEIQLRRAGFKGLKKLFKRAGLQKGTSGSGVLFAPHWWFIEGLDREEEPDGEKDEDFEFGKLRRVGPSFDRVLPQRVRQHWHEVLRATQIDLMYLEDGVSAKSFERVLRQILDIYDRNAGKRKAEDHLFRGIPKVKVMIHEYAPGNEFDPGSDYPEPKFMELSRARVLHVFKDRGDATELEDVPFDMSWEPEPMGVFS